MKVLTYQDDRECTLVGALEFLGIPYDKELYDKTGSHILVEGNNDIVDRLLEIIEDEHYRCYNILKRPLHGIKDENVKIKDIDVILDLEGSVHPGRRSYMSRYGEKEDK